MAMPLAAQAQQPAGMRRVGVLMTLTKNNMEGQARLNSLSQGLEALGWIHGRICTSTPAGQVTTSTACGLR